MEKQPELRQPLLAARQEFRQNLRSEIELGREFGRELATPRGKDIDKEAKRVADQALATHLLATPNRSARQFCEEALRETKSRAQWSIDDFLREDFRSLMVEVGNRQGLPCDFIAMRFERVARRFVDRRGQPADAQQVLDPLLRAEVGALGDNVSNCLAAQARAAEYRVVPEKELEAIRELLSSLEGALMPDWERRINKVEGVSTATERVEEFLRQRRQK